MKSTFSCLYCPKILEVHHRASDHMGPARLKAITANHVKAMHPEHYKPSAATLAKRKANQNAGIMTTGKWTSIDPNMVAPLHDNIGLNPKPKRVYTKRLRAIAEDTSAINYCPQCGLNLRIAHEGIKLARGQ